MHCIIHYICKLMHRIISSFLIFHFLLLSVVSTQINRMPVLVEHYYHHKYDEGEEKLSFGEFLSEHYFNTSSHEEKEDHSDLPLFSSIDCVNLFTFESLLVLDSKHVEHIINYAPDNKNYYDFTIYHSIFQPPKFS